MHMLFLLLSFGCQYLERLVSEMSCYVLSEMQSHTKNQLSLVLRMSHAVVVGGSV